MMSDRAYDLLKTFSLLVLPIGTFIFTLCTIWKVPFAEQIQQTFIALDVFCGALTTIAKNAYDKQKEETK